jgi:hypothetical protein
LSGLSPGSDGPLRSVVKAHDAVTVETDDVRSRIAGGALIEAERLRT